MTTAGQSGGNIHSTRTGLSLDYQDAHDSHLLVGRILLGGVKKVLTQEALEEERREYVWIR